MADDPGKRIRYKVVYALEADRVNLAWPEDKKWSARPVEELSSLELNIRPVLKTETTLKRAAARAGTERVWLGIALCAAAGISYGIQAPMIKWAYANGVNVSMMLAVRFIIAALGVWALIAVLRPDLRLSRMKMGQVGLLGLIFITSSLFFYLSVQEMAAGTATLLVYTFPALVVLWSVLFFKERMGRTRWLALGLALLGCMLTIDPVAALGAGQNFSWLGAVFALGSAFSNSIYNVLSGLFGKGISGLVIAFWSVPVTALAYTTWMAVSGQFQAELPLAGWACCVGIGVLTAFSIGAYLVGLKMIGPSRASITATSEPATTVVLGILLLAEPASPLKLAGGAMIIGAVLILSRRNKETADEPGFL
jgi:drug/metabolite transporter (DMT)-like permease